MMVNFAKLMGFRTLIEFEYKFFYTFLCVSSELEKKVKNFSSKFDTKKKISSNENSSFRSW